MKMIPIKFHSKLIKNVGEISNFLAKLKYKLVIFYGCDVLCFSLETQNKTTKVSKEDFLLVDTS